MNDFYVNACGTCITPALIHILLVRSGLQWEMHPAQIHSLEMQELRATVEVAEELAEDNPEHSKELMPSTGITLCGIIVNPKEEYPKHLIRLMYNGEEVTRIDNLAIPVGFCAWGEEETQSERSKMEAIGYRSNFKK